MFCVNVAKVRGKMTEKGFSIVSLSKALGINRNTLSSYLENPGKIPYAILNSMAELLCDNVEEAISIFFTKDLRVA